MALAPAANTNAQGTEETGERVPVETSNLSQLAAKHFGNAFKGDVKETPPTGGAEDDKGGVAVEDPPEGAETEEVEGDTPPETDAAETAGDETGGQEETAQAGEEGEPISSLDELAEHYQWDREWLEGVQVPVKVDGQPSTVPLKDLIANHQMNRAADNRLEKAKEQAQTITQGLAQREAKLQSEFAIAADLIQKVEGMIDSDVESVNWADLRETDPAEYSAKTLEIEEKRKSLQQIKEDAAAKFQESIQSGQEDLRTKTAQYIQAECNALVQVMPEWTTQQDAEAGIVNIRNFLMKQGFPQEQVVNTWDHKMLLIADKARRFDEMQAKTPAAQKKIKKVPKVLRPGAPKSNDQVSREKVRTARNQVRKTGSMDDALALVKMRRGG